MSIFTDLVHNIEKSADLDGVRLITNNLLGQACWKVYLGYADELLIEIGERNLYPQQSGPLVGKFYGTWRFGSRGTSWHLNSPLKTIITSRDNREAAQRAVASLTDSRVERFEINFPYLDLIITFDNTYKLHFLPEPADDQFEGIPYWELFTPGQMLLSVGPGSIRSYRRADSVIS